MADIRKIILLDGTRFELGDILFSEKYGNSKIESMYFQKITLEETHLPIIRIYIEELGAPYLDIPFHNVGLVFYS